MNQNPCILVRAGWRWAARLLLALGFYFAVALSAQAQSEEGIKAAFIYNFSKFVEWPASTFADEHAPFTVGFLGADSLADVFAKNVVGKNADGRDFAIKRLSGAAGAETCQIVFIGDAGQVAAVLGAVNGKPILTIGASDGFAAAGGMINLVKEGAKIRFDLDVTAVKAAQLKLTPKLLQIARNVKGG